jgi:hypothetical protein
MTNKLNSAPSVRSRAAKRASSPSIDLDKSLKNAKPPAKSGKTQIPAHYHESGVTKKAKRGRQKSSKAYKRQMKGLERAEIVSEKLEKKLEGSIKRGKNVKDRRACCFTMSLLLLELC